MPSEKQIHAAPAAFSAADTKHESKVHIDRVDTTTAGEVDKRPIRDEARDHTGAHGKTDPEELKLVRKLDYGIMWKSSSNNCVMRANG